MTDKREPPPNGLPGSRRDEKPAGPRAKTEPRATKAQYKAALRRAVRRNAHEPDVNFLNITAMLDIMTIILVFLLKTLGESSTSIPQSEDLRLPTSVLKTEPTQEGVKVVISKSQLLVGDTPVLELPKRDEQVLSGAGLKHKRGGPNDLYIVPLGNALQDARNTDKLVRSAAGEDTSMSEAVIVADETTPWRLFVEVLFTLGQSEYGRYHLMVMQKN